MDVHISFLPSDFQVSFRHYTRRFLRPLRTAHGEWAVREGFILRVECSTGAVSYGEVAPIPEFGSETVARAEAFLRAVEERPALAWEGVGLRKHPCCAFALGCALRPVEIARSTHRNYQLAGLLPAGSLAVEWLARKASQGFQHFKWKIGVEALASEHSVFERLVLALPPAGRVRLDANGGLSRADLEHWLQFLRAHRERVEFIEQPLPPGQEALMAALMEASGVAIGLDESLNGEAGNQWLEPGAWKGPLIIKPALMGDPWILLERLRSNADRVIFSSVFETAIGFENVLRLADALPEAFRPLGFDTMNAFDDDLGFPGHSHPQISASLRAEESLDFEGLWKRLLK